MAPGTASLLMAIDALILLQAGSGLLASEDSDRIDYKCNKINNNNNRNTSHDCKPINYSMNTSPENKTVVIIVAPILLNLSVTLFGDECELSCCHDKCQNDSRVYKHSLRINAAEKEKFVFSNVVSKYFCGQISIGEHCDTIGTDTESHPIVPFDPPPPPESKVNFLMILAAGLCLFLVVIFALLLSMKKSSDLLVVPSDESDAPVDAVFADDTSTALLLYSRDSPAFLNLMTAFRELMVTAGDIQVLDPLDSSRFEEVAQNPSGWLSRELVNPRTKVIIVVSDVAILRQRALLSNLLVETPEPHFLDGIFTQALRHLHDNPYYSSNYSRIFTVRFEDTMSLKENLSLIVPLRCFNLPRHMTKLICEIKGLPNDHFESVEEDLRRSPTLTRLQEQLLRAATERNSTNQECVMNTFLHT